MEGILNNKVIVVTGAGRGIGRVIAEQMAKDGAVVYANDLQAGDMEEWANDCSKKYGTKIVPIFFNVTDSAALKANLMSIYKAEGRIDCVVNNAAIIANQKLGMVTKPLMEKMFAVNVFAVIDMLQIASRLMLRQYSVCHGVGGFTRSGDIFIYQRCHCFYHQIGSKGIGTIKHKGKCSSPRHYKNGAFRRII